VCTGTRVHSVQTVRGLLYGYTGTQCADSQGTPVRVHGCTVCRQSGDSCTGTRVHSVQTVRGLLYGYTGTQGADSLGTPVRPSGEVADQLIIIQEFATAAKAALGARQSHSHITLNTQRSLSLTWLLLPTQICLASLQFSWVGRYRFQGPGIQAHPSESDPPANPSESPNQ